MIEVEIKFEESCNVYDIQLKIHNWKYFIVILLEKNKNKIVKFILNK